MADIHDPKYDDIDQYLEEADAEMVPEEFITAALVIKADGDEYIATMDEVADILDSGPLENQGIEQINAVIDMEYVKERVIEITEQIFASIKR